MKEYKIILTALGICAIPAYLLDLIDTNTGLFYSCLKVVLGLLTYYAVYNLVKQNMK